MNKDALATRLGEYLSQILPDAHGHQPKAVSDFARTLIAVQTCCQTVLARFFDNFEAASKRAGAEAGLFSRPGYQPYLRAAARPA